MQALNNLDRLTQMMTDDERESLDEYIRQNDLFAVNVNLANDLQLSNNAAVEPVSAAEKKLGLPWMTALARLELGAMLSAYTQAPRPFEVVSPTSDDIDAYRYLLLEAIRSHYLAMKRDPEIDDLFQPDNLVKVLSYSRRLNMVQSMLQTLGRSGWQWTTPEIQELTNWKTRLDDFNDSLEGYVESATHASGTEYTTNQSSSRTFIGRYCIAIANGINRDLENGRATVETTREVFKQRGDKTRDR